MKDEKGKEIGEWLSIVSVSLHALRVKAGELVTARRVYKSDGRLQADGKVFVASEASRKFGLVVKGPSYDWSPGFPNGNRQGCPPKVLVNDQVVEASVFNWFLEPLEESDASADRKPT